MQNKKITVITVCYNAAASIESTILSVLNQTYPNIEYIVIDGGSNDGTVEIIKKYSDRITYWISEPDNGIYNAMNKGIRVATGDYINFMNAGDNFIENDVLSKIEPFLMLNPTVAFGSVYSVDTTGNGIEMKPVPFYEQLKKLKDPGICHQGTFVRSSFLKLYGFDTKYSIAADYNLLKILYEKGEKFLEMPICIARYDTTGFSSANYKQRIKEFAEISGLNPDSIKIKMDILLYPIKRFIVRILRR